MTGSKWFAKQTQAEIVTYSVLTLMTGCQRQEKGKNVVPSKKNSEKSH